MSSLGQGLDGTAVPGVTSRLITSIGDGEAVLRSAASLRMLGHAGPRCALPVPRSHLIVSFTFQDHMQPGDPQAYHVYVDDTYVNPGDDIACHCQEANQYSLRYPAFS